ncbi:MAG: type II toxin-antitoxin system HicB family antitoxin [Acidobacteriota bacterium]
MKQAFTASIWQEDEWFVAQCFEVDVASQGKTEDEALEYLRDALEVHFTPPVATLVPEKLGMIPTRGDANARSH